jgi:hypothetical protein
MTVRHICVCKWSGTHADWRLDMCVYINEVTHMHLEGWICENQNKIELFWSKIQLCNDPLLFNTNNFTAIIYECYEYIWLKQSHLLVMVNYKYVCKWSNTRADWRLDMYVYANGVTRAHIDGWICVCVCKWSETRAMLMLLLVRL